MAARIGRLQATAVTPSISALARGLEVRRRRAPQGKHVRHDCSAYASRVPALFRQQRKRVPKHPKALLRKEVLPRLLAVSDLARRVYLGRARFLNGQTALSYPSSKFLLRTLGSPQLYSCIFCGAPNHRLTKAERKKRDQRSANREPIIACADAELREAGLLEAVRLRNNFGWYDGTKFILPDASRHVVSKHTLAHTFFEMPEFFYMSGAGAIWQRKDYELYPLPEHALRLLIALLSEHDVRRYGGVNPALISFRNGELVIGGILVEWERIVDYALKQLMQRGFVSRRPSTVSSIDGHLIRPGFSAAYADEQDVEILVVRAE
jgi:hypothetical protein